MLSSDLINRASMLSFDKPFDAVWHHSSSCSVNSTKRIIISDIVAATYSFITDDNIYDFLYCLSIAKKSTFKFDRVSGDEFVLNPETHLFMKVLVFFTDEKKHVDIKCKVYKGCLNNKFSHVCTLSTSKKLNSEKLRQYSNFIVSLERILSRLRKIEEIYNSQNS